MTRRLGMTRRELERELAWMLRNPPEEPRALAKAFAAALVTLLDKNNERISQSLSSDGAADVQENF